MTETVESTTHVNASADDVWTVLSDIGSISRWAAPIADAQVEGEPGEGARRHCEFAEGGEIDERFVDWQEGKFQRYEIEGDLPADDLVSEWELDEDDEGTNVTYRTQFTPSEDASPDAARDELGGTSDYLVEALKTYVETGETLDPPES